MTAGRLLVVTTVHAPDDARIRSKLIASLAGEFEVTYATKEPGPASSEGLTWHGLRGGRTRRWLAAARLMQDANWDLVAVHDPELLPAALLRALRRRSTLFDVHENVPAQLRTKAWVPPALRRPVAWLAGRLLRAAERTMTVTLAEAGYADLFRRPHHVIPNYPLTALPAPSPAGDPPYLAYLGDITEQRGAFLAIDAAAGAGMDLVMVGRIAPPELAGRLTAAAGDVGVDLRLTGQLPHSEALIEIAGAWAGLAPLLDIPNYRWSLPTKVLEYLALGLPVLAADLPGTRAVTGDLTGMRFVRPGDPAAWRQAGKAVAEETALRSELVAQAERVRSEFRWPSDQVVEIYAEAARR